MKCPHCGIAFFDNPEIKTIGIDVDGGWILLKSDCPSCKRMILRLASGPSHHDQYGKFLGIDTTKQKEFLVRPKASLRPVCPPEVPKEYTEDYSEACLVISDSPKASASLSRRCLQHILREEAKVKPGNLADEIQQVIDLGALPSHLTQVIDVVRNIGNFAAHPLKSEKSGEILPVEPAEAEWNLDVLEALFDFYFVQPAMTKKKREALDEKLKEAGKKPIK